MLRRSSIKSQAINDENSNQVLKSKISNQTKQRSESTSNRSRTVLGVIPDHALNSTNKHSQHESINQQQTQFLTQNQLHSSQNEQQQQQQQQIRNKIPVLVENSQIITRSVSTSSASLSDFDDEMEVSQMDHHQHKNQNVIVDSTHHDIQVNNENEHHQLQQQVEEEEEDDDDEEIIDENLIYNEPLSPILTESIRTEIDRVYSKFSRDTLDPNDEDTYDVTMVAEYGNRIFNYLHSLEFKYKANPKYIEEVQVDLLWEHRATLMDWLVQLHSRFNLLPETLFLATNIIDRFLSKRAISLSRFQLCGAAALFIAAKYEEINVPTVSQMVYMVGNQYSRESFLRAEKYMVEVLGFEFGWPGPMSFLRRGSKADDYDNEIRTLAKYFLEITIMDARFVSSPPSWLAAGAQFLSRRMLGRGNWTEAHVYYTGYTAEQLLPLAEILEECCISSESHHRTIFQKYSERRFKRAATYVQEYLHELYGQN
jgi:G2/mitotic-specific cyclin 3/4